jgi:hypothetical protein
MRIGDLLAFAGILAFIPAVLATSLKLVGSGAVGWVIRSVSDEGWERGEIAPRARAGAEIATA